MTKPTDTEPAPIVTSLRIPRDEHAILKALAKRDNRSLSGQMRHLIKQAAAEQERQAA